MTNLNPDMPLFISVLLICILMDNNAGSESILFLAERDFGIFKYNYQHTVAAELARQTRQVPDQYFS